MSDELVQRISISNIDPLSLLGQNDATLRAIEAHLPIEIILRDSLLTLKGPERDVRRAAGVLHELIAMVKSGATVGPTEVAYFLGMEGAQLPGAGEKIASHSVSGITLDKKVIRPKSRGQEQYLDALLQHDIVFAIGPAGTGKTYLAVAMALHLLRTKRIDRILLVRPAVEAGESLGFLPGDLKEKVDPYLRPLYDSLHDMMPFEKTRRLIDLGVIEVAPLAFMRGRTLSDAFVIMDEGQNATVGQMKMFLTRLGLGSRAVITGDVTQIDLVDKEASGLVQIQRILGRVSGIKFLHLTEVDVVRHRLVRDIIRAFEEHDRSSGQRPGGQPNGEQAQKAGV
jgi:phosphate starvation-inducible PhoH-like protein